MTIFLVLHHHPERESGEVDPFCRFRDDGEKINDGKSLSAR